MVWVLVCVVGLGLETGVIIVLGRQVTRRYEAEAARVPDRPLVAPRDPGRSGRPDRGLRGPAMSPVAVPGLPPET
jgi:hypothetical protein